MTVRVPRDIGPDGGRGGGIPPDAGAGGGRGVLYLVGMGPGHPDHMTGRARAAVAEAEVIVGYTTYLELLGDLAAGKRVVETGMTEEVDRARAAVELAEEGRRVAVVSSGDAGIYGMAGLVLEVLAARGWQPAPPVGGGIPAAGAAPHRLEWSFSAGEEAGRAVRLFTRPQSRTGEGSGRGATGLAPSATRRPAVSLLEVEVVPGVSALNAAAALVGAPLMNDFAVVSLSDHLTPWEVIARRLEAAGAGDMVVVLYNPKSGRRTWQLEEAVRILRRHRSGSTPAAAVKSAFRERQLVVVTTLEGLVEEDIGMLTTVIVGNSATRDLGGLLLTPRGYERKYELGFSVGPSFPEDRLGQGAFPLGPDG